MHFPSDLLLTHDAARVVAERRALAERLAHARHARRAGRGHGATWTVLVRTRVAAMLALAARRLAHLAEDLDPTGPRPVRG